MQTLEQGLQSAWNYVFEKLYNEKTGIIYDYRTSTDDKKAFNHLPTPKEVQAQIPNPCGWDTGMENGAISAGLMLSAIACRYHFTKDKSLHAYAEKTLKGLQLLTSVSGIRGFLARSVLPEDGKSFYFESSRDQYTFVVYGAYQYITCPLCTDEEKAFLSDMLVSFAEYAEKCVTEENDWQILRADGKDTMVCQMLYSAPHEWTRLPMIYLAAYKVSGNKHWLEKYKEIRGLCIEGSFENEGVCAALDQMQISIHLLHELEDEEPYRSQYEELANRSASALESTLPADLEMIETAKKTGRKFDGVRRFWRECPMTYLYFWGAPRGGYAYYKPQLNKDVLKDHLDAKTIARHTLVGEARVNHHAHEQYIQALVDLFTLIDFENNTTEAPIYMLQAYWLTKAKTL